MDSGNGRRFFKLQLCNIIGQNKINFKYENAGHVNVSKLMYYDFISVVLHTSRAANETLQNNTTVRQPRYSGLEEPIFLIRPVTKNSSPGRIPINRKSNPIPMAPMMGNGFVIRTKTGKIVWISIVVF